MDGREDCQHTRDSAFGLRSCAADMMAVLYGVVVEGRNCVIGGRWGGLMFLFREGMGGPWFEMKLQLPLRVAIRFFSLNFFCEPCMARLPLPLDSCQLEWGHSSTAPANDSGRFGV